MVTPPDARRIRTLLEFAARHHRYVVLDVPRSDAAVLDALEGVSRIIVVANQELATVRSASRMAAALRQRYGKDKLQVVVSRADRLADIGHEDVERAVGSQVRHSFPSDYRRALQALNKGRPVTLENHNELLSSFVKFARVARRHRNRQEGRGQVAGTVRHFQRPQGQPTGVQVNGNLVPGTPAFAGWRHPQPALSGS